MHIFHSKCRVVLLWVVFYTTLHYTTTLAVNDLVITSTCSVSCGGGGVVVQLCESRWGERCAHPPPAGQASASARALLPTKCVNSSRTQVSSSGRWTALLPLLQLRPQQLRLLHRAPPPLLTGLRRQTNTPATTAPSQLPTLPASVGVTWRVIRTVATVQRVLTKTMTGLARPNGVRTRACPQHRPPAETAQSTLGWPRLSRPVTR